MPAPSGRPRRAEDIRRHNLGLVLSHVHRDGELTRAELTQRLGLSRSTIGDLVADLDGLGLVSAHVPTGGERAGRPSHVVGPRADGPYVFAVDVDVSHVCVAAVGIAGHVLARIDLPLRPSPTPASVIRLIVRAAQQLGPTLLAGARPIGVGVSIPGTVSPEGTIGLAPNLGWRRVDFADELVRALPADLPITLGNDADLSVLAERQRGAARGCDHVVYLLGRVGVGAGMIANGQLVLGRSGYAGEIGHNVMDPAGPQCRCGKRGCVETYIGDAALLRRTPEHASAADVLAAAAAGDSRAQHAVREVAHWLGRVAATVVNTLDPELMILGGSLAGVLDIAGKEVTDALTADAMTSPTASSVLRAPSLGSDSALLGAAELAFAALLEDPLLAR